MRGPELRWRPPPLGGAAPCDSAAGCPAGNTGWSKQRLPTSWSSHPCYIQGELVRVSDSGLGGRPEGGQTNEFQFRGTGRPRVTILLGMRVIVCTHILHGAHAALITGMLPGGREAISSYAVPPDCGGQQWACRVEYFTLIPASHNHNGDGSV